MAKSKFQKITDPIDMLRAIAERIDKASGAPTFSAEDHTAIEAILSDECRTQRCGYFRHYLAYGPAELTHEGYHAAEDHCRRAQDRIDEWLEAHPSRGDIPAGLLRMAEAWEKRVRA